MRWNMATLAKEMSGGVAAAVVSIPSAMGYGIIAFAPLGAGYAAMGLSSGFLAAILAGLLATLLGGSPGLLSGPKAPLAILFSTVIAHYVTALPAVTQGDTGRMALSLALIAVLLAGVFQVLFGLLRIGNLIKWIPYPVIAGFLNGTAVLIAIGQFRPLLGLSQEIALDGFAVNIQVLTALVGIVTALVMWHSHKFTRRIHGSFVGLAVGTGLYYLLAAIFGPEALGPRIGEIVVKAPEFLTPADLMSAWQVGSATGSLSFLVMAAASLAILASLDSLMTAASFNSMTNSTVDVNRELAGQGVSNIATAMMGGIASAGSIGCSSISYQAGGRGRLSGVVMSLVLLAVFVMLTDLVESIPKAVLAGILLVIGLRMFDPWSIKLFAGLFTKGSLARPDRWQSALVMTIVMLVAVFYGLIMAVSTGVAAAIVLFVSAMSRDVVRRRLSGKTARSNQIRDELRTACLDENGAQIQILELEGALFFGSTGHISKVIDRCVADECHYLVLDLKRVRNMDITSARIFTQFRKQLAQDGTTMVLSHMHAGSPAWDTLADAGYFAKGEASHFDDTVTALEYLEDLLIDKVMGSVDEEKEVPLADFQLMEGISARQLEMIGHCLNQISFAKGDRVIRQGNTDRAMYFLVRGAVDVTLNQANGQPDFRLRTMTAGTVFGEMSMLQDAPRSANVVANSALLCYSLTLEDVLHMQTHHPDIMIMIMSNLARLLAGRLRYALDTITELQ